MSSPMLKVARWCPKVVVAQESCSNLLHNPVGSNPVDPPTSWKRGWLYIIPWSDLISGLTPLETLEAWHLQSNKFAGFGVFEMTTFASNFTQIRVDVAEQWQLGINTSSSDRCMSTEFWSSATWQFFKTLVGVGWWLVWGLYCPNYNIEDCHKSTLYLPTGTMEWERVLNTAYGICSTCLRCRSERFTITYYDRWRQ